MHRTIPYVILALAAAAITACSDKKSPTSSSSSGAAAVKDPNGDYKLFSDPTITRHPEAGMVIGKGQLVEFKYDGSKGRGLSYQLYYVDANGSVHPDRISNFDDKGNGLFSSDIKVFNSNAHQRPGFLEVITVADSGLDANGKIAGKIVKLGMYDVRFEVAE